MLQPELPSDETQRPHPLVGRLVEVPNWHGRVSCRVGAAGVPPVLGLCVKGKGMECLRIEKCLRVHPLP